MKKLVIFFTFSLVVCTKLFAATRDIVITNLNISDYREYGWYQFNGDNQEFSVTLGISTQDVYIGHFEEDKIAILNIVSADYTTEYKMVSCKVDVTHAEGELMPKLKGTLIDTEGTQYNLDMSFVIPEAKGTKTCNFAKNSSLQDIFGQQFYTVENEDTKLHTAFKKAVKPGHYTKLDVLNSYIFMEMLNEKDETGECRQIGAIDVTFDVTERHDTLFFSMDMLGTDTIRYAIHYFYTKPQPESFVTIDVADIAQVRRYSGDYQIIGLTDSYKVALDIYTDELDGTYTKDDLYSGGSFVVKYDKDGEEIGEAFIIDADIDITTVEGRTTISARLFCDDLVEYTVNMWYEKPQPKETVILYITDSELTDNVSSYGTFHFEGQTTDKKQYVSIAAYSYYDLDGHYTLTDMDGDYSFIRDYEREAEVHFSDADFTVTTTNGVTTLTGDFLGENLVLYKITIACGGSEGISSPTLLDSRAGKKLSHSRIEIVTPRQTYLLDGKTIR